MVPDLQPLGRLLLAFGLLLAALGLLLLAAPKLPWIGRLPGDILIQRERFSFYFPLASSLLASLLLSLVLWFISRFRQ
jgi:hypothetical protein